MEVPASDPAHDPVVGWLLQGDPVAEGQAWTATSFVLTEPCDLGLDPTSPVVPELVGAAAALRWEHAGR